MVLGILWLAGCSTVPDPYIPRQVGSLTEPAVVGGLSIEITPLHEYFKFQEPVFFQVALQNTGRTAYWVPRRPYIIFYWIYPSGIKDHYVRQLPHAQFLDERDVVLLEPGHRLLYTERIDTYYFPRPGIMDFRAMYVAVPNTNPAITPYWSGRLHSNTYGLRLF